jgi:uncharacterized protein (DUF2249 family)
MFSDHIPGQPYELTMEQFCKFAALQAATPQEMWVEIARWEAGRTFNPYSSRCHSCLSFDSRCGTMEWEYRTTSGTTLRVVQHREMLTEPALGYPGSQCSDEMPPSSFTVTIPADRDQPGRYHWEQLRNGGAYCE